MAIDYSASASETFARIEEEVLIEGYRRAVATGQTVKAANISARDYSVAIDAIINANKRPAEKAALRDLQGGFIYNGLTQAEAALGADGSMPFVKGIIENARTLASETMVEVTADFEVVYKGMKTSALNAYRDALTHARAVASSEGYEKAVKGAMQNLAEAGLTGYVTEGGAKVSVDTAIRGAIENHGLAKQITQTLELAGKWGMELVEVNCSMNPRPSHAEWEGQIYALAPDDEEYPYFNDACHVGDPVNGIGGYNCHHWIRIWTHRTPRLPNPREEAGYSEKEARSVVAKQRRIEANIRTIKRERNVLQANGEDVTVLNAKIRDYQAKLRKLVSENAKFISRASWREAAYKEAAKMSRRYGISDPFREAFEYSIVAIETAVDKVATRALESGWLEDTYILRPMTFREADNGAANPRYTRTKQRLAFMYNCQSCVVVHEMRMRGYDIITRPYGNAVSKTLEYETWKAWRRAKVLNPQVKDWKELKGFVENEVKQGERYHIAYDWASAEDGHILTIQRDELGDLFAYCPQSNTKYFGVVLDELFKSMNIFKRIDFYRVDNLTPRKSYVEQISRPAND